MARMLGLTSFRSPKGIAKYCMSSRSGYFRRDHADCGHIPDGKFRLRKRKANVSVMVALAIIDALLQRPISFANHLQGRRVRIK